jgi:small GTP-binding protein
MGSITYTFGCVRSFVEKHVSTAFDHYRSEITVDGTNVGVNLWDTGGRDDYDKVRGLVLQHAHAVLLVYAVDNAVSLANVRAKWALTARHFAPDAPVLLVGTKLDRRTDAQPPAASGASGAAAAAANARERNATAPVRRSAAASTASSATYAQHKTNAPSATANAKESKGAAAAAGAGAGMTVVNVGEQPQPSAEPPGARTVIVLGAAQPKRSRARSAAAAAPVQLVRVEDAVALSNELKTVKYMECRCQPLAAPRIASSLATASASHPLF